MLSHTDWVWVRRFINRFCDIALPQVPQKRSPAYGFVSSRDLRTQGFLPLRSRAALYSSSDMIAGCFPSTRIHSEGSFVLGLTLTTSPFAIRFWVFLQFHRILPMYTGFSSISLMAAGCQFSELRGLKPSSSSRWAILAKP